MPHISSSSREAPCYALLNFLKGSEHPPTPPQGHCASDAGLRSRPSSCGVWPHLWLGVSGKQRGGQVLVQDPHVVLLQAAPGGRHRERSLQFHPAKSDDVSTCRQDDSVSPEKPSWRGGAGRTADTLRVRGIGYCLLTCSLRRLFRLHILCGARQKFIRNMSHYSR